MKSPGRPAYDIAKACKLVKENQFEATNRVRFWLENHDYFEVGQIKKVFVALEEKGEYIKTVTLRETPDKLADVYLLDFEGSSWYIKFYIHNDSGTFDIYVKILSCHWEGC